MPKGWKLVSLYPKSPSSDEDTYFVSFAHYTGRPGPNGGSEYDKVLRGEITIEQMRRSFRRHLELKPGNKNR